MARKQGDLIPVGEALADLPGSVQALIRPGGVFVNTDVAISAHPGAREQSYRRWATHLVSCGIDEQRAYEHFAAWSAEDTYFSVDDELAAMREAKFHSRVGAPRLPADGAWRRQSSNLGIRFLVDAFARPQHLVAA